MGEREELLVTTTRKLKSGNETGVLQMHKTFIGFYMLNMSYGEKPLIVLSGVLYSMGVILATLYMEPRFAFQIS